MAPELGLLQAGSQLCAHGGPPLSFTYLGDFTSQRGLRQHTANGKTVRKCRQWPPVTVVAGIAAQLSAGLTGLAREPRQDRRR